MFLAFSIFDGFRSPVVNPQSPFFDLLPFSRRFPFFQNFREKSYVKYTILFIQYCMYNIQYRLEPAETDPPRHWCQNRVPTGHPRIRRSLPARGHSVFLLPSSFPANGCCCFFFARFRFDLFSIPAFFVCILGNLIISPSSSQVEYILTGNLASNFMFISYAKRVGLLRSWNLTLSEPNRPPGKLPPPLPPRWLQRASRSGMGEIFNALLSEKKSNCQHTPCGDTARVSATRWVRDGSA